MANVAKRSWTSPAGEPKSAWVVRYAHNGRRLSKQFERKKDADTFRRKVEAETDAGQHVAAAEALSIRACCQKFLESATRRLEARQIGKSRETIYKLAINKHIVPHLGAIRLSELTWGDLEEWIGNLDRLAPRSRDSYTTVFKMVEEFAIKRGHAKKPTVAEFCKDRGSATVAPIRTFTAEQVAHLLRTLTTRPSTRTARVHETLGCAVNLAAFCGLRYGEVMGLTVGNIDFGKKVIRVRHSLTQWGDLKGPKTTAGRRDIPLPDHIAEILRRWIDEHYLDNEHGLLFRSSTGTQINHANWAIRYWGALLKQAGLWSTDGDQFHFHALRHFAASWMIEHGLPLPDVASLLGHSKFDMTLQVYAHPIVGGHRRHEAFSRMSDTLRLASEAPVSHA